MTEQKDSMFQPLPQGLYGDESMDDTLSRDFGLIQDGLDFIGAFGKAFGDSSSAQESNHQSLSKRQKPLILLAWEFTELTESLIANYDKFAYLMRSNWSSLTDEQREQIEASVVPLREMLDNRDEKLSWQKSLCLLPFSILKGKNIRKAFIDTSERAVNLIDSLSESSRQLKSELGELELSSSQGVFSEEENDEWYYPSNVLYLSEEATKSLLENLDNPPKPSEGLVSFFRKQR